MSDIIGRARVIVSGEVDPTSLNKASSKIGAGLKKAAVLGVGAFGVIAAAGIKASYAAEEAAAVQNKLNKVLDNMGKSGAAAAITDLASAEQRKTGVDDEVIKKGQTILATFSQVASSAGEAGGAFERATKLSLDLAASGFGSVDGAAKQLGKALQDPVKGLTALNKSGVTFTATQKEQIKQFVKTGDVAKAQNLILAEVEKQVGGTAEAGAKGSDKIQSAFGELEEAGGNVLSKLSGKDGLTTISDALFDVADALNTFAESDSWAHTIENLKNVGGAARDTYEWLDKVVHINDEKGGKPKENLLNLDLGDGSEVLETLYGELDDFFHWQHDVWGKDVKEDFRDTWANVKAGVADFSKDTSTRFGELNTDLRSKTSDIKSDISTKFGSIKSDIKTKVTGWKTSAVNALTDLPGKMRRAGANAIQGFLDGLGDLGGSLGKSAGRIAQRFKDAINDALPDSLTFFGGKGGVPAITIPLPQLATGVRNFTGGLALVGERGPEVVNLPAGSDVYSNRESRAMGATQHNTFNFYGPESFAGARRDADWSAKHGGRFGSSTRAVVPA
jgi:phage-related minor tail protein